MGSGAQSHRGTLIWTSGRSGGSSRLIVALGRAVDPPLALDLYTDGLVSPSAASLLASIASVRPRALRVGDGMQKHRPPEAAATLAPRHRERLDVAAAAGQQPTGDPSDEPTLTASNKQ
jgi:hypothetical protein